MSAAKPITMEEVAQHGKGSANPWTVIDGKVYDMTEWQHNHPGGKMTIVNNTGKDASEPFHDMHDPSALGKMEDLCIGHIVEKKAEAEQPKAAAAEKSEASAASPTTPAAASGSPVANEAPKKPAAAATCQYNVVAREEVSHNTQRLNFVVKAGEEFSQDGLIPGGHFQLQFKDSETGKDIKRNYTPFVSQPGSFELIVKVYEGGKGSGLLHSAPMQSPLTFKGPLAPVFNYRKAREAGAIKTLVLIAGGTGVAPMYSIAEAALKEKPFAGRVLFMGAFRDESEILMEKEVVALAQQATKPSYMSLSMCLSRQKEKMSRKRDFAVFSDRLASQHVIMSGIPPVYAPGTVVVCCGTMGFNKHIQQLFVEELKYPKEQVHLM